MIQRIRVIDETRPTPALANAQARMWVVDWDEGFFELRAWMTEHDNRTPRSGTDDPVEKQLAESVSGQRKARNKKQLTHRRRLLWSASGLLALPPIRAGGG
jgi:hypothetical protein